MKKYRIAPEVKEQIMNRIKNDDISVSQEAKKHGVSDASIYGWIGSKVDGTPSAIEFAKVNRERDKLLRIP